MQRLYFSGDGVLSQDWEGRASIGNSEAMPISRGKIDEFYMADTALNEKEVTRLMDQCIFEKGVLFFEVPLNIRQRLSKTRSALKKRKNSLRCLRHI